jgi:2-pyrone-4,6-dicarboxylate lactonase
MRCTSEPPPYPSLTPLARLFAHHAPERMVLGLRLAARQSRGMVMPNDGDLLDLMLDWVPDETTRHRILVQNPNMLYGFQAPH